MISLPISCAPCLFLTLELTSYRCSSDWAASKLILLFSGVNSSDSISTSWLMSSSESSSVSLLFSFSTEGWVSSAVSFWGWGTPGLCRSYPVPEVITLVGDCRDVARKTIFWGNFEVKIVRYCDEFRWPLLTRASVGWVVRWEPARDIALFPPGELRRSLADWGGSTLAFCDKLMFIALPWGCLDRC